MPKLIVSYHEQIEMLKLGCTIPNLAKICPHKFTDAKFNPLTEDEELFQKVSENIDTVVDTCFFGKSTNLCR